MHRDLDRVIHVSNLKKSFNNTVVLNGVSLSVPKGAIYCLIGPSGVGKSTLLRCINLLETPSSGLISISGNNIYNNRIVCSDQKLIKIRQSVGMVFQQFNLFPHLTSVENIMVGLVKGLRISKDEALEISMNNLARVGLQGKELSYPSQLSGGQQQRVGIARALALKPVALLFDEPTSSLDPELAGEVLDVMRHLANDGMTMLIATHELEFANEIADQVVFMDSGGISEQGVPSQLLFNPQNERTAIFLKRFHDARRTTVL